MDLINPTNQDQIIIKDEEIGGIEFDVTLTANDIAIDLTDASVLLVTQTPSGNYLSKACTVTSPINGMVMVVLDADAFFELGEHAAEIRINVRTEINISQKFYYTSISAIDVM